MKTVIIFNMSGDTNNVSVLVTQAIFHEIVLPAQSLLLKLF